MGTSIHSVEIWNSNISDYNMIFFKIDKNSSTELVFSKVKRMSDQELASWTSTPMSFIQMEWDLIRLTSEMEMIYQRAYITICKINV